MPKILNAYVHLWDDGGKLHTLAPGDELPEWAVGKVGSHVLTVEVEDPGDASHDADDDTENDRASEESEDADGESEDEAKKDTATPDFTKPRSPRQRRK